MPMQAVAPTGQQKLAHRCYDADGTRPEGCCARRIRRQNLLEDQSWNPWVFLTRWGNPRLPLPGEPLLGQRDENDPNVGGRLHREKRLMCRLVQPKDARRQGQSERWVPDANL